MKRIWIGILAASILAHYASFAQRPGQGGGMRAPAVSIIGKVVDSKTNEGLASASVILYSLRDSSIFSGAFSKPDGSFEIGNLRFGRFYLAVKFVGYEKKIIDNITVRPGEDLDLGEIKLSESAEMMQAVDVVGEREKVEYKLDRKIINVGGDIVSSSGSAVDALERAPSIEVDIEGNVSLRGSSNFTVFVNGRPTVLDGSDALKQIPATSIDRIELITNPSVKFDPDGLAGIINVVLKENNLKGFSGMTGANLGMNDKYGADLKLNYGMENMNLTAGVDYNSFTFRGEGKSLSEYYYPDYTRIRDSEMAGRFLRKNVNVKLGAEYFFGDNLVMSLEGGYGEMEFSRKNKGEHFSSDLSGDLYAQSRARMAYNRDFFSANYNMSIKLDEIGQKLDVNAYFSQSNGGGEDFQEEFYADEGWKNIEDQFTGLNSEDGSEGNEIRFKADYVLPWDDVTKFEMGAQARIDLDEDSYKLKMYDTTSGEWYYNDLFDNVMDYSRNIYAAYAQFASEIAGLQYMAGLRAEYTDRRTEFSNGDDKYVIDRVDWFPSLHISKKFDGGRQLMASYSRRINRPEGRWLDPFPHYRDSYNYHVGNPELEPEYTNSYELGVQQYFDKSFITMEAYYRDTDNEFERYRSLDSNGIMYHTAANLASEKSLGVELMLSYKPWKWFNFTFSPDVFYHKIEGDIVEESSDGESMSWRLRAFGDFNATENLAFELKSFFRGARVTAQGKRDPHYSVDIGARYRFLDDAATITLSMRDVFNTRRRKMTSSGEGFYTFDNFERESGVVLLNFSYRFNNYKSERRRGGGGGDEDGETEMF